VSILKKSEPSQLDTYRKKKRKWWLIIPLVILFVAAAWYIIPIFLAYNNATTANTTADAGTALKQNAQGEYNPINVLLIGEASGNLADSIIVASIDPETKTVSMLSVPRDLYVPIPGYGKAKINAAHSYGESGGKKGGGPALLKQVVSTTLGIPIHYFIRVDFDGFRKLVDAVGGVDINVKTSLNDPEYPCDNDSTRSCGFSLKPGEQHMNGITALKYARCRKGTCGNDFGRAMRQQDLIKAVREKALSAQVLANPKKVTDIISVLGSHILTDFSASETTQALSLVHNFDNPTIRQYVFDNSEDGLVVTGRVGDQSVVLPRVGDGDYSELQAFTKAFFREPRIAAEKPTILVRQGSATKAATNKVAEQLKWAGFTVQTAKTADTTTAKTTLYGSTSNKAKSAAYLKDVYSVTPQSGSSGLDTTADTATSTTSAASPSPSTPDFELVVGSDIAKILQNAKPLEDNADGQNVLQSTPTTTSYQTQGAYGTFANTP
jgi:LCP family protein required for cell wall assembly